VTFTDDDLKRLKDHFNGMPHYIDIPASQEPVNLSALLARLEAAERFTKHVIDLTPDYSGCIRYKAWRKAAGK
jgi:hypothetical protein